MGMLAQLCNIYFETNIDPTLITYKLYFDGKNKKHQIIGKTPKESEFNAFRTKIKNYIYEEESENRDNEKLPKIDEKWTRNHMHVSNMIRNPLTHSHDPYGFGVLNNVVNFRNIPAYDLKRVIEDYKQVSDYIIEVAELINFEMKNNTNSN